MGEPIRWEKLWNGLYWLETRDAGWVLAMAYPMGDDVRDETLELAQLTERDRKSGIDNTCGFRFYRYEASRFSQKNRINLNFAETKVG